MLDIGIQDTFGYILHQLKLEAYNKLKNRQDNNFLIKKIVVNQNGL